MPTTNRPMMNMIGWTAKDCKHTATTTTMLLSNMVYFLYVQEKERGERERDGKGGIGGGRKGGYGKWREKDGGEGE